MSLPMFASGAERRLVWSSFSLATDRLETLGRLGALEPPTLLELPGTARISRLVREVEGGGLAALVRLEDLALEVTGVLLDDLDRRLIEA